MRILLLFIYFISLSVYSMSGSLLALYWEQDNKPSPIFFNSCPEWDIDMPDELVFQASVDTQGEYIFFAITGEKKEHVAVVYDLKKKEYVTTPWRLYNSSVIGSWSPDKNKKLIALGYYDGTVALCDINQKLQVNKIKISKKPVVGLCWGLGGRLLCVGLQDGSILLYDIKEQKIQEKKYYSKQKELIKVIVWSPDNKKLAIGFKSGYVHIINILEDNETREIFKPCEKADVISLAWNKTSQKLAIGFDNGKLLVVGEDKKE